MPELNRITELEAQLAEALDVLRPIIGALHCGTHKLSQGELIRVLQAGAALLADTTVSTGKEGKG